MSERVWVIADVMTGDYTVATAPSDPAARPERLTLFLDGDGKAVTASGPGGELQVRQMVSSTPLEEVAADFALRRMAVAQSLLVVVTGADGEIVGLVAPRTLADIVLASSDRRGYDGQLGGFAEPVGVSRIRCAACGHIDGYSLVEPGVTPCTSCGRILRSV